MVWGTPLSSSENTWSWQGLELRRDSEDEFFIRIIGIPTIENLEKLSATVREVSGGKPVFTCVDMKKGELSPEVRKRALDIFPKGMFKGSVLMGMGLVARAAIKSMQIASSVAGRGDAWLVFLADDEAAAHAKIQELRAGK